MRKFFALALAVAMVMSLASVAFAVDPVYPDIDENGDIVLSKFYKYSADSDALQDRTAEYGKSYYAVIFEGFWTLTEATEGQNTNGDKLVFDYDVITDYDDIEKLKIKTEFEMGEDLVESVSIVKKNIKTEDVKPTEKVQKTTYSYTTDWDNGAATDSDAYTNGIDLNGYYYCVEIKTKAQRVTGEADIIGTFEFNRKADNKKDIAKIDDEEVDFNLNLLYEHNYNVADSDNNKFIFDDNTDSLTLKWDDLYLVKFDNDDEVEFEFGSDPNEGTFTVDASGQGKLVIDFSTKANEAICDANPGVKMNFVNFNGAKFNRVGEFEYEMEDLVAAYQVVDGQLVAINGLEIDSETATFSTRTLGNYVFATAELVNPTPVVEAPAAEAPAVTNPSTGAAA